MEKIFEIAFIEFSIPLWQMIFYFALLTFFMFTWRMKAFFATSILFILYWGYLFRPYFLATVGSGFVPTTAFALFSLALVGLLFYTLFLDMEADSVSNFPTREMAHLRKALLKRMDKLQKALLNEAQAQVRNDGSKLEEIQQEMDAKLLIFRTQLEEESASRRELEIREIQGELGDKIRELEGQIRSKDELLAAREREKEELAAQSRANLDSLEMRLRELEARLREKEETLEGRKAEVAELEKKQFAKIDELEDRLSTQLSQLATRSGDLEEIRSGSEKRIALLEAELHQKTAALEQNRETLKGVEESLKRKIQQLEHQLMEREAFSEASSAKELAFAPLLAEYPPSWTLREKIEALLEPEMEKLWADLVRKGMLSEEKQKEAQIIQQKMN